MDRRQFIQQAGAVTLLDQTLRSAPNVVRAGLLGTRHSHTTGKLKAMQDNPDYQVAGICENDAAIGRIHSTNDLTRVWQNS